MRTRFRQNDGFTLIEIMIALVILGILASIAFGQFKGRREEAMVAGLKSDLRNLATREEAYFADNLVYSTDLGQLGFTPSPNVTITLQINSDGWTARATNPLANRDCALYSGNIAPLSPAKNEGIVWCE